MSWPTHDFPNWSCAECGETQKYEYLQNNTPSIMPERQPDGHLSNHDQIKRNDHG